MKRAIILMVCTLAALAQSVLGQTSGWLYHDVGIREAAGESDYDPSTGGYMISCAGQKIGVYEDSFGFLYQRLEGDGQITLRVKDLQANNPSAQIGLMFRANLSPVSVHASGLMSANGAIKIQSRAVPGSLAVSSSALPASVQTWLRLSRTGNVFAFYRSADGITWELVESQTVAMGISVFAGIAVSSNETEGLCTALFDNVEFPSKGQDIGNVGVSGTSVYNSSFNSIQLKGSGVDIGGTADSFHYLSQYVNGNGQVVARIDSLQNTNAAAKAGVMMRESVNPGAPFVSLAVTPSSGAVFLSRTVAGKSASLSTISGVTAPCWLKLVRNGATITGYRSTDGINWTLVSSKSLTLPTRILGGLAVTSKSNSVLCTADFSRVSVTHPWVNMDIGTVGKSGMFSFDEQLGIFSVAGAGADIGGITDAYHYVFQPMTGDGQLVAKLRNFQSGHVSAKAGLMISSTLTATAQNASLFATPGTGIVFQSRTIAGKATVAGPNQAGTAPLWLKLLRKGNTISGFTSLDGISWTQAGSQTVVMPAATFVGLAVSSRSTSLLGQAEFSEVEASSIDVDHDALPDPWETLYFGSTVQGGASDFDGDGKSNLAEYRDQTSPDDFYNGVNPILSIVDGDGQTGDASSFLPVGLRLQITTPAGNPIQGAPVRFSVTQGGGFLAQTHGSTLLSTALNVATNASGQATGFYKQSGTAGTESIITAQAGSQQVMYSEYVRDKVATPTLSPDGGRFVVQQDVTVYCSTPGATIHYTFDGSEPTGEDPAVASGQTILVPGNVDVIVKALKTGWFESDTRTSTFTITGAVINGEPVIALRTDGTVWTWGGANTVTDVSTGQLVRDTLATGSTESWLLTPREVLGIDNVIAVSSAGGSMFALRKDGTLWAWGNGLHGRLGDGASTIKTRPIQVMTGVKAVSSAGHTVVLKTDGTVWTWGWNSSGQIGDNTVNYRSLPFKVASLSGSFIAVAAGSEHTLAVRSDGTVWAWGSNAYFQIGGTKTAIRKVPAQIAGISNVVAVAGGRFHSVARKSDGTVWCWGKGGRLGVNNMISSGTPQLVPGIVSTEIATNYLTEHTLSLGPSGTVMSWGENSYGSLANGSVSNALSPVRFAPTLSDAVLIAAGGSNSFASGMSGAVWFAGSNERGAFGNGLMDPAYQVAAPAVPKTPHPTLLKIPNFSLYPKGDPPTFTPVSGYFAGTKVAVTLRAKTANAKIFYTVNGATPTENDPWILSGESLNVEIPGNLQAISASPGSTLSLPSSAVYESSLDTDRDGLPDAQEQTLGTNPLSRDTDKDGVLDGDEVREGSNPNVIDRSNPLYRDTDHDGMPDRWETDHYLNPANGADANLDSDGDGVANSDEYDNGSDPKIADTDNDGVSDLSDGWPRHAAVSPPRLPIPSYVIVDVGDTRIWKVNNSEDGLLYYPVDPEPRPYAFLPESYALGLHLIYPFCSADNDLMAGSFIQGTEIDGFGGFFDQPWPRHALVLPDSPRLPDGEEIQFGGTGTDSAVVAINSSGDTITQDSYLNETSTEFLHRLLYSHGGSVDDLGPRGPWAGNFLLNDAGSAALPLAEGNTLLKGAQRFSLPGPPYALSEPLHQGHEVVAGSLDSYAKYIWRNSKFDELPYVDSGSAITNINNRIQIVGYSYDYWNNEQGILWQNGRVYQLGDLAINGADLVIRKAEAINDRGMISATGYRRSDDSHTRLLLLPVDITPDYNRDKLIDDKDKGKATQEKPYRFWLNNDYDKDDDLDGEPLSGAHDNADGSIKSKRDLEDFARLDIYLGGLHEAIASNQIKVGLKWKDTGGTSPSVKIWRNLSPNGGLEYVTDDNVAGQYLQLPPPGHVQGAGTYIIPQQFWQDAGLSASQPIGHILFEGVTAGKGQLVLVFQNSQGQEIGEGPGVWLDLRDVKKFYKRGKAQPENFAAPNGNVVGPPSVSPSYVPDEISQQFAFEADPNEEKKAVIFVHGWSMNYNSYTNFAETMFKRLFHQGFKGRFCSLRWDPLVVAQVFDISVSNGEYNRSEHRAFHYGESLKQFANAIKGEGFSVSLVGHSMGNIVCSSSLQKGLGVQNYVLMEAAVPAGCYDTSGGNGVGGVNAYPRFWNAEVNEPTPDFHQGPGGEQTKGYRGFFDSIGSNVAGEVVNFHNRDDYALATGRILLGTKQVNWEANEEDFKPDGNPFTDWHYHYYPARSNLNERATQDFSFFVGRYITESYEMKSFVARPRSRAVGAVEGAGDNPLAGGSINDSVNMRTAYGFTTNGYDHSGQFNRRIQQLHELYLRLFEIVK